jgi:hypothetical protein
MVSEVFVGKMDINPQYQSVKIIKKCQKIDYRYNEEDFFHRVMHKPNKTTKNLIQNNL